MLWSETGRDHGEANDRAWGARGDRDFLFGAPAARPAASGGVAKLSARREAAAWRGATLAPGAWERSSPGPWGGVGQRVGANTFAFSAQAPSFGEADVKRDWPQGVASAGAVEAGERPCRVCGGDRGCDR